MYCTHKLIRNQHFNMPSCRRIARAHVHLLNNMFRNFTSHPPPPHHTHTHIFDKTPTHTHIPEVARRTCVVLSNSIYNVNIPRDPLGIYPFPSSGARPPTKRCDNIIFANVFHTQYRIRQKHRQQISTTLMLPTTTTTTLTLTTIVCDRLDFSPGECGGWWCYDENIIRESVPLHSAPIRLKSRVSDPAQRSNRDLTNTLPSSS